MDSIAIEAHSLGKLYKIGAVGSNHDRLGEQLLDLLVAPIRRASLLLRGRTRSAAELTEEIWALRNVAFTIDHGEVVGVLGRNGAGKTTLLKILSRITEPTEGYADLYGRVGSLLEVGTGFHPELTGRENVFLNGSILGMTKSEIESRFDEIIAFAELEQFIDTPVKHYSSGMYVRLAFSVAAHLDPEILLVDEVLAVGDTAFQRKSLGRMDDVAKQGRTVIFVSHNLGLMQSLCQRGILIESGEIIADGLIADVVETYLALLERSHTKEIEEAGDRRGVGKTRLIGIEVAGDSVNSSVLRTGGPARFSFELSKMIRGVTLAFNVYDHIGQPISTFRSDMQSQSDTRASGGGAAFTCSVDELLLMPGRYRIDVAVVGESQLQDYVQSAAVIEVGEGLLAGRPIPLDEKSQRYRTIMPHRWTIPAN